MCGARHPKAPLGKAREQFIVVLWSEFRVEPVFKQADRHEVKLCGGVLGKTCGTGQVRAVACGDSAPQSLCYMCSEALIVKALHASGMALTCRDEVLVLRGLIVSVGRVGGG